MTDTEQTRTRNWFEELRASVGPMQHLPNNGAAYHTGENIVTHLNRVLGPLNWDFTVLEVGEEPDSDECWARVQITVYTGNRVIVKQDYGSQAFKRARSTGKYVSKWDDKKAAITDGLKRAARLLGVGLDAWANEKAPSWRPGDDVEATESAPKRAAARTTPKKPLAEPTPLRPIQSLGIDESPPADDPGERARWEGAFRRGLEEGRKHGIVYADINLSAISLAEIQAACRDLRAQIEIAKSSS